MQELAQWKQSPAGEVAKEHGFYEENQNQIESSDHLPSQDELERFFLTKLGIEKAQQENPQAKFSINTPFALMTDEEFSKFVGKSFQLGNEAQALQAQTASANSTTTASSLQPPQTEMATLAAGKDWSTESNCVAPVKNQGGCGSCWAFAAVGALESAFCIKTGAQILFSEQHLLNCDGQSLGCQGGWPKTALQYVQRTGSICTAESYPYGEQQGACGGSCVQQPIQMKNLMGVPAYEESLLYALNAQPVAIAVAAGNYVWKQYTGGIITGCPSDQVDHAVLAVGYGEDFIKIKNSWGTYWGDNGYAYVGRGSNACGIINPNGVFPDLDVQCNC